MNTTNINDLRQIIGEITALKQHLATTHKQLGKIQDILDDITEIEGTNLETHHPEYLETEGDYKNAPRGTIVAADGEGAYWGAGNGGWIMSTDTVWPEKMAQKKRRVLRWGWEA
ncbi:hypothetical protein H7347_07325 [Corynebacterium sp. zg-331]|uniref:hypothetical protein n=1 Tax=unclassified Corynebacterium TaxID=2624378 RepID=UPI00128D0D2B|nr:MULTISPECIES: hypothetical protein [unclassified Corynebacterium]MBC3186384.1 hypothetical protein [Corynebacterium sp. zg-331]MPV52871.1 hypothetical protein [Corynebacterium sp. zg331]